MTPRLAACSPVAFVGNENYKIQNTHRRDTVISNPLFDKLIGINSDSSSALTGSLIFMQRTLVFGNPSNADSLSSHPIEQDRSS